MDRIDRHALSSQLHALALRVRHPRADPLADQIAFEPRHRADQLAAESGFSGKLYPASLTKRPRLATAHIDWRVLAFTGGLAILTGLLLGLAAVLYSSRRIAQFRQSCLSLAV